MSRVKLLLGLLLMAVAVTWIMFAVIEKAGKPVTKIEYRSRR